MLTTFTFGEGDVVDWVKTRETETSDLFERAVSFESKHESKHRAALLLRSQCVDLFECLDCYCRL